MKGVATAIVNGRFVVFALFLVACIYCGLSVGRVQLENTLTAFLPENTETRQGIVIMDEEFTTYASASVMLSNVTFATADKVAEDIRGLDHVVGVSLDDSPAHFAHSSALLSISFDNTSGDAGVKATMGTIRAMVEPYDSYISTSIGFNYMAQLAQEMVGVIAIAAVVIMLILLLTSRSYFEVAVSMIVFVVAALLNMGTNFWLGKISSISNSVAIILQLALAIDYAIILSHRYQDTAGRFASDKDAIIDALSHAIPEIASSSLTTISGLLALTLMQFGLGPDLGWVLAKGILCSLISVFFLMPGLILCAAKLLKKTAHKPLLPSIEPWGVVLGKAKNCFVVVFALVIPFAVYFSGQTTWAFNDNSVSSLIYSESRYATEKITATFDESTDVAIIVPSGNYEGEKALLEEASALPQVKSAMGLANIKVSDKDDAVLTDSFTPRRFAELLDIDLEQATLLFQAYGVEHQQYQGIFGNASTYTVPLIDLFEYLFEKIDQGVVSLGDEKQQTLDDLRETLRRATDQLRGANHSRMVLSCVVPAESPESVQLVETVRDLAGKYYDKDSVVITGNITSARDLADSFSSDSKLISILTALFVFVILLLTFRSVAAALIMVFVIQGAIWINFSFPYLTHFTSSFVTYMICSAIQMGATIDYAIVMMNRYQAARQTLPPKPAMAKAVAGAFPTVLTSGLIMAVAGLLIAFRVSDVYVGHIGLGVGRGAIISVILVLTVLPQLMVLLDSWIERTRFDLWGFRKKAPRWNEGEHGKRAGKAPAGVIAALLVAVLLAGAPVGVNSAWADNRTVRIETVSDLQKLAKDCATDSYSQGLTVELAASLDLTGVSFQGIPYFAGTFRGNGYEVTGLSLVGEGSHQGFFRYVTQDGRVQNLTIKGSVNMGTAADAVGGLVGLCQGVLLSCSFDGAVVGASQVGGLVGVNQGTLVSCGAAGTVEGQHQVGGLVGANSGGLTSCWSKVQVDTVPVSDTVSRKVTGFSSLLQGAAGVSEEDLLNITDIGGIAGLNTGVLECCTNHAAVGYAHMGYNVGGVAGRSNGVVKACLNYGEVQGRRDAGGVVGQLEPYTVWDVSASKLTDLRSALGSLHNAVNGTMQHAGSASSQVNKELTVLGDYLKTASSELESVVGVISDDMDSAAQAATALLELARDVSSRVDGQRIGQLLEQLEALLSDPSTLDPAELLRIARELAAVLGDALDQDITDRLSAILANIHYETPNFTGFFEAWQSAVASASALRQAVEEGGSVLSSDLKDVFARMNSVGTTMTDTVEDVANVSVDYQHDVSATNAVETAGTVVSCENKGVVQADNNAGGVVGSIAFEVSFDLEDELRLSDALFTNAQRVVSATVLASVSTGDVTAKKQAAGGIVGASSFGAVAGCVAGGTVEVLGGSHAGGIAGRAGGMVQGCSARTQVTASSFVGGIAGEVPSGAHVADCRAYVALACSGANCGAIAGGCGGEALNNLFVENERGGIDGISYEGRAMPVSYDAMISLPGTPDLFRQVTVSFVDDQGQQIDVVSLAYGGSVQAFPAVAPRDGECWRWDCSLTDLQDVRFSRVVSGAWGYPVTTLGTEGAQPLFLVEGVFDDNQRLEMSSVEEPAGAVAAVRLTVPGYDQPLVVRARAVEPCQVAVNGAVVEAQRDGSYVVFSAPNSATIIITAQDSRSYVPGAVAAVVVVLLVLGMVIWRRRRA